MDLYGNDLFGDPIVKYKDSILSKRFLVPPFSVLNTRDGFWQDRKKAWLSLGIESEIGRNAKAFHIHDWIEDNRTNMGITGSIHGGGTSIFDPILCELIYTWFSNETDQILDPFAGGSVRGIVASCLNRKYWGSDLRQEQIEADREQCQNICESNLPKYICGDSLDTLQDAPDSDLIFSCPPYGDLEVYSDDPRDLSNMEWYTFLPTYKRIILRACKKLKQNRFACFVVSDFRDKKGHYRNFVSETIAVFLEQGLKLYNEAILINSVGSARLRASKQFNASRKLVKVHQNILIFVKGDWKKAAGRLSEIKEKR